MGEHGHGSPGGGEDAAARRLSAWIARGDQPSLDEFYRAWFNWCYVQARSLTRRDESFCLDVVQEVMIRVARSMKAMPGHADLERWMMRVVHTTALDLLRRESRRAARERARGWAAPVDGGAELSERVEWVRRRLGELPAEEGWLLWLRFGKGRTLAAAGSAAQIGTQAAHGRIRRTLERLRGRAKEESNERS